MYFFNFQPARKALRNLWALFFGVVLAGQLVSQSEDEAKPPVTAESLEAMADRIHETRMAASREEVSWKENRVIFSEMIALREKEIAQIDEFTKEAKDRVERVSAQRAEFEEEEAERKAWRADFEQKVQTMENQVRSLIPQLPEPVLEKVGGSVERLELADEDTPLQDRFRDLLSVLASVQEFNGRLTVTSEIREVEGEEREVDILYIGMTQAWYVDRGGRIAGIGRATASGWQWEERSGLAGQIRQAIDVQRREAPPVMVSLLIEPNPSQAESE